MTKAQDILEEYTNTYLLQLEQFKNRISVTKEEEQLRYQEPRPVKAVDEKEATEKHRELKEQLFKTEHCCSVNYPMNLCI